MARVSSASRLPIPTCSPALASTAASPPLLPAAQHCPLPTARCPLHIAHCSLQAGRGLGFRRLGTWREGRTADRRAQGSAHEQQEASQEGGAGLARFPPGSSYLLQRLEAGFITAVPQVMDGKKPHTKSVVLEHTHKEVLY